MTCGWQTETVTTSQTSAVVPSPYPGASDAAIDAWWRGFPIKRPSWGFPDYLIAVAAWLVFSVISAIPIAFVADPSAAYAWVLVASVIIPWLGMGGYPWLISKLRGNGMRLDFGLRFSWADLGWGVLYGIAALLAASVIAAIISALFGEFDSSAGELAASFNDFPIQRLLFAIAVGFGAPIIEELCYRGLLLTSLLKRDMSKWLSIVLSAALFAAMHLEPIRFALLFAIGLILGLARVHRNNTTTAIVAHMTNNIPGAIGILFLL
jgi:membrane protease YdiL (CAAX protease family)